MTHSRFGVLPCLAALAFAASFLTGCGDDDSFSPVSKNRGYDYAYTSAKNLSETPCNEMREGREAVIGRNKDRYECRYDYKDSVYIWVGYDDTLTAEGREFNRPESSSSSEDEDESSSSWSSSSYSSSSYSSSSYSSSSYRSSSSYSSSSYSSSSISSSSLSSSSSVSSSSVSSSSVSSSSTNWEELKPRLTENGEQFNPNINYGTMTDPRDNKTYRTVVVDGVTWMAENLNYTGHEIGKSYCFKNDEEICKLYGRLYSRDAAMNSSKCVFGASCLLGNDPIQGICPDGWHIPTYSETQALVTLVSKKARPLMSTIGWGTEDSLYITPGVDTYGLSFVGVGQYDTKNGFNDIGEYTLMWVYYQSTDMYYLLIRGKDNEAFIKYFDDYESNFSVRCVKGDGVVPSSSSVSSSSMSSSSSAKSSSSVSSSSEEESSSSFNKAVLFNSSVSYGEMTDGRDGKTYRTVVVDGKTWMAENLNFADSAAHPLLEGNNRCYGDDPGECSVFGRLYSREAALNDSRCTSHNEACPSTSGTAQGVCPDGWHIPSPSEAEQLVNKAGGNQSSKKLNSSYGWDAGKAGTNEIGTSFTGTGAYRRENGDSKFSGKGSYTNIWIFDVSNPKDLDYLMVLGSGLTMVANEGETDPFFPVRCIKN